MIKVIPHLLWPVNSDPGTQLSTVGRNCIHFNIRSLVENVIQRFTLPQRPTLPGRTSLFSGWYYRQTSTIRGRCTCLCYPTATQLCVHTCFVHILLHVAVLTTRWSLNNCIFPSSLEMQTSSAYNYSIVFTSFNSYLDFHKRAIPVPRTIIAESDLIELSTHGHQKFVFTKSWNTLHIPKIKYPPPPVFTNATLPSNINTYPLPIIVWIAPWQS